MFRSLRRTAGRIAGFNPLAMQAQGLMGAIGGRRQASAPQGYIDDSLPPQSASDPNFTLQALQKRRRSGVMGGMGGALGGKI